MSQHILIVDDDQLLRSSISRCLHTAGYTTSCAEDGVSGEQRARAEHPDLVVLDMRMAGRSGLETLAVLRGCTETCAIPIVMLSGSDEDFEEARRGGANGMLLKPFRLVELLSTIQKALGSSANKFSIVSSGSAAPCRSTVEVH